MFVEIEEGIEGLVHISELSDKRVARTTDVVKEGDKVTVKVIGFDNRGKIKLSIFDRSSRKKIGNEIALATSSQVVQQIGKTLVLYRQNVSVKPTLSNINRYRTK